MIFCFLSARPALILWRPTACGSILRFTAVFIKYRKLGQEVDPRERRCFPRPPVLVPLAFI